MSTHIEQPSYGDLLDTVRGLVRYSRAARQYLPLHLGTNLVELSTSALDQVLRAECVQEGHVNLDADWPERRGA